MDFILDFEQEEGGRWIAEISELPGVLAYGATPVQAGVKAKALALRVLAERMEQESVLLDISGSLSQHAPMTIWPSVKAPRVLAALLRIGWTVKRQAGSHKILSRPTGRTWFFPFMTARKSAPGCWPAWQSTAA